MDKEDSYITLTLDMPPIVGFPSSDQFRQYDFHSTRQDILSGDRQIKPNTKSIPNDLWDSKTLMRASVAVDRAMICRSTTHKRRCEHSHTATSNAQMGKCGKVPTDSTLTPQLSCTHAEPHVKEKVVAHTQLMSLS